MAGKSKTKNINRVVLEGELLADPLDLENRCRLRLLVMTLQKEPPVDATAEPTWIGRRNEFEILVWGALAARCVAELREGSAVVVEGRLEWIQGTETPTERIFARTEIVADEVRFLAEKATPAPELQDPVDDEGPVESGAPPAAAAA